MDHFALRLSSPNSTSLPRSRSLNGSRILPVFVRHSCVYSVRSFCSSASSAAVFVASAMKVACCASSVETIATESRPHQHDSRDDKPHVTVHCGVYCGCDAAEDSLRSICCIYKEE